MSSYYDDNAKFFFDQTFAIEMSDLYSPFLERLPLKATILDAGCGSGRDTLVFAQQGYQVQAFDACPDLVKLARQHTCLDVQCTTFTDLKPTLPAFMASGPALPYCICLIRSCS